MEKRFTTVMIMRPNAGRSGFVLEDLDGKVVGRISNRQVVDLVNGRRRCTNVWLFTSELKATQ